MMSKSLHSVALTVVFVLASVCTLSVQAADPETGPASKACEQKLEEVADELARLRDRGNSSNDDVNTSSNNAEAAKPNPISDIMAKMSEGQQKMAQLQKQATDDARNLKNERFKQLNTLNDKMHEFRKGEFKHRQEINNAATAKKAKESQIRIKCYQQAEAKYNKDFGDAAAKAAMGTLETNNVSQLRGTKKRMQKTLATNRKRCMSNPATQEELQNVQDEYDSKIHNFRIAHEEIQSDINYTNSKMAMMEMHMGQQAQEMQASYEAQAAALQQANTMNMVAAGFAALSSASSQEEERAEAKEFRDLDQIIEDWDQIVMTCRNSDQVPWEVPADIYLRFTKVNNACRGDFATTSPCVKSSGENTPRNTPRSTSDS